MRLKSILVLAAAAAVVIAAWPSDADAQSRRRGARSAEAYPGSRVMAPRYRRTRVTVRRERSFLDPGTEVLPRSRGYTDYAFPVLGSADRVYDPTGARRFPLPDSLELPGYSRY